MAREPMVECTYGWGHVLRLYQDYLDLNGTCYALNELVYARPIHRCVLGISSIRLELRFRGEMVVLRGIVSLEKVRTIVAYLNSRSLIAPPSPLWLEAQQVPLVLRGNADVAAFPFVSQPLPWGTGPVITNCDVSPDTFIEPYAGSLATRPGQQRSLREFLEQRLVSLREERSQREHGFDVEKLAQRLHKGWIPQIRVPVRLLFDENAYYCTNARLYSEPRGDMARYRCHNKDQGTLILTDRRVIYIGRKRQLVLGYEQLLHITRLRGAIALLARNWASREIFEIHRPLECVMYLECILRRFQQQMMNSGETQPHTFVAHVQPQAPALPPQEESAIDTHDAHDVQEVEKEQDKREIQNAQGQQAIHEAETLALELPPWLQEGEQIEIPEEFKELVEWSYRMAWRRERGAFDD